MKVESRLFADGEVKKVLLLSESEHESKIIDTLGDDFSNREAIPVSGEIRLSDGFREHYILLGEKEGLPDFDEVWEQKFAWTSSGRDRCRQFYSALKDYINEKNQTR